MLKNILSCLITHRQTGISNMVLFSVKFISHEYGSNNSTYEKKNNMNLQMAMNRRYCITFCISIFYLQLTYLDFLNERIPPFSHSSLPTCSSPEKRAPGTEITVRIILTAQRNVTAFMELSISKTCIGCECITCLLLMLHNF